LRPILDVIGFGAHKLSEISGRLNQPSTSLTRPMERLRELDFIEKELPFQKACGRFAGLSTTLLDTTRTLLN